MALGRATEPSSSTRPAAGVDAPPGINTEPTRVAAMALEYLTAATVHRRRVFVAMHKHFYPAAAAISCGVNGGDGTGDGEGKHGGVVTGSKGPAAVGGAGTVTAMDTSGAAADEWHVSSTRRRRMSWRCCCPLVAGTAEATFPLGRVCASSASSVHSADVLWWGGGCVLGGGAGLFRGE